jgi:phosphoribosylformylglycinamidine synthase subunit PurQ / glutaminase
MRKTAPTALVLQAIGTNRDLDVAEALRQAGAEAQFVHLNQLRSGEYHWSDFQMLVLPGGFSYADALGAGKLLALDLQAYFADEVQTFVASGKPAIGICNGFQTLVKSGILPQKAIPPVATLTFNARRHFECRWVTLQPLSKKCVWTAGLTASIYCPIAHGEGNFVTCDQPVLEELADHDQIALVYTFENGTPAAGNYPENPNGSLLDIAGVCNPAGNVLGLMPHPENHIFAYQHPRWTRGEQTGSGLTLFQKGVEYAAQL